MKPPDARQATAVCCALFVLLVCVQASELKFSSEQTQVLPPPPLLNVNVPANSFARLDVNVPKSQAESPSAFVSSVTSTVVVTSASDPKLSFENTNSNATEADGTGLRLSAENIPPTEDVVTKTSVQGSVTELIGNDTGLDVDDQQPVTRTSLRVSEVELGANGEIVGAVSEANLQDAVTQTSVKITEQEIVSQTNLTEQNSTFPKPDVGNIQEILKQIQNEVGEARILYVADPKAKTGWCSSV